MTLTRRLSSPTALLTVATSIGVATVVSIAAPASAISNPVTLNFVCASVTPANAAHCPIGAAQFSAVVSPVVPVGAPPNTYQALFSFKNIGSLASSIIKIDITDKAQYSLDSRISAVGFPSPAVGNQVVFSHSPAVPTGAIHHFISTATGANAIQRSRGINQGESLNLLFSIPNVGFQKPFNAVVADLFHSGLSVELTAAGFGSIENQRSTQVVFNSKVQAVPEPITMLGSGAALGFGVLMKRRFSKLKAKKAANMPVEPALESVA